jgi:acetyltransferase-like isoleucine patch superfamily enzyme
MRMDMYAEIFHPLQPGNKIEGDWCNFPVPFNMEVGENTVIDSSYCFKKFFSQLPLALKLGNNITLQSPSLATGKCGYIEIGDYSFISSASIVAYHKIIIGSYVYIAIGVTIVDTDFHPVDPALRLKDTVAVSPVGDKSKRPTFYSSPVIIEDDVWIGYNATILKGVTIGKGVIIQPGTIVTKSVPANSMVYGNPAEIKTLEYA